MNGIEFLDGELDYLNMTSDMVTLESVQMADNNKDKVSKIKEQFNVISTYLDKTMTYISDYVDTKTGTERETEYEKRIKALAMQAQKCIDMDMDLMSVYDNRDVFAKYNKIVLTMFDDLDNFISKRGYKNTDEVIKQRDAIIAIIKEFDKTMESESELKVWINPETVKRVCLNAIYDGAKFNMSLKEVYMNVTRLNNKIANITKDGGLKNDIKTELIGSSLMITRKVSSFCIKWNKHLMCNYPMVKA